MSLRAGLTYGLAVFAAGMVCGALVFHWYQDGQPPTVRIKEILVPEPQHNPPNPPMTGPIRNDDENTTLTQPTPTATTTADAPTAHYWGIRDRLIALLIKKRYHEAMAVFNDGIQTNPTYEEPLRAALMAYAKELLNNNRSGDLVDFLAIYLQTEHLDFSAFELLGAAFAREHAYEKSIHAYYQAKQKAVHFRDINRIEERIRVVVNRFRQRLRFLKNHDELLNLYRHLTQIEPTYAPYVIALAETQIELQRYINAEQTLKSVIYDPTVSEKALALLDKIHDKINSSSPYMEIPLQQTGSSFVLEAMAGGQVLRLLLDTGASMTALDEDWFHNSGLYMENTGDWQRFLTANGIVDAPIFRLDVLSIGQAVVENLQVSAMKLNASEYDGLLGMNFLKHYQFIIDQENGLLRLYPLSR